MHLPFTVGTAMVAVMEDMEVVTEDTEAVTEDMEAAMEDMEAAMEDMVAAMEDMVVVMEDITNQKTCFYHSNKLFCSKRSNLYCLVHQSHTH